MQILVTLASFLRTRHSFENGAKFEARVTLRDKCFHAGGLELVTTWEKRKSIPICHAKEERKGKKKVGSRRMSCNIHDRSLFSLLFPEPIENRIGTENLKLKLEPQKRQS